MIAAVVALAGVALVMSGGLVGLALALRSEVTSRAHAMEDRFLAMSAQADAEDLRDAALAEAAKWKAERSEAEARAMRLQSIITLMHAEESRRVNSSIASSDPSLLFGEIGKLLSEPILPGNPSATGHDPGDA